MHPSHRYSSRYSNRHPEVGLPLHSPIPDPDSIRLTPPPPTRLDSTRMAPEARSLHLPFFTLNFNLDLIHLTNQTPYPRKGTP